MKKLLSILLIIFSLTFISCQNQTVYPEDYSGITTWGALFDAYWQKMSTNYVFWSLDDYGDTSWQSIYDEYLPKFNALGDIDTTNTETLNQAYRYYFDVTKNLSDGHYNMYLTPDGATVDDNTEFRRNYDPDSYTLIKNFKDKDGNTVYSYDNDDAAYEILVNGNDEDYTELYNAYYAHLRENMKNIGINTFGITDFNFDSQHAPTEIVKDTLNDGNLYYYYFPTGSLYVILGLLPEDMTGGKNIIYFGFSNFSFDITNTEHAYIVSLFQELVINTPDIDGIIIDARGNGGGRADNLNLLWKIFTNGENIQIANTRRKGGDERQNYLAWQPFYIMNSDYEGKFDTSIPIAYIINNQSASCAEMSALFFKALGEYHEYKTAIIGEHSAGAQGMLLRNYSEQYYNAGYYEIEPYLRSVYTPFLQTAYLNGEIYEGKGVPVDGDQVYFDYDAFTAGTDAKLQAAITWVNDNAGGN